MDDFNLDDVIEGVADNTYKKRGRPNNGLTEIYRKEADKKRFLAFNEVKDSPNNGIIEHVEGEIIPEEDLEEFRRMFNYNAYDILERLQEDEPELTKKHPHNWYKKLLIRLKDKTPKISINDIDRLTIVWEELGRVLLDIGLYPTKEMFYMFVGYYGSQFRERAKVSPKHFRFLQKITEDTNNALINDLHSNPYNQTNKIFLAKCNGIIEKTEPKKIEVEHTIQNYDNISSYRLQDKNKKQ